jgi:tricarballylate dehydrogenase
MVQSFRGGDRDFDVVVVGAGNAALCAALSVREASDSVLVLERAPFGEHGGNTAFTGGAMRVAYRNVDDLLTLLPDLTDAQLDEVDFGSYPETEFLDDIGRVTEYRCDAHLADVLVRQSLPTLQWMRSKGVRFMPSFGRQAFRVNGKFKFWGGLPIEVAGGGSGLVEALTRTASGEGVEIAYGARAVRLIRDRGRIRGVEVRQNGDEHTVLADAVILACGGFEANAEWRARYLGPGWDLAKVRGTRFNTGDGIRMALEVDAMPCGHWSGAHSVAWDLNAPLFGDLSVGDGFQKHSYPFGIMVNALGERFVDEGADFRNFTYAKYGADILRQPQQSAWQIFDSKVAHLLRDEYRIRRVSKVVASTLEELATRLDGIDATRFLDTVHSFNRAVDQGVPFDPTRRDGRCTRGLAIEKSNWANTLDEPPFCAYNVTCGITFTFGGIRINTDAEVLDTDGGPIGGLYACGELVGGLFYFNYPGGAGLTSGAVFGRVAGQQASKYVKTRHVKHAVPGA